MSINNTTPLKAIREKCLDCMCGAATEVRQCPITDCSLYPFRFGKKPYKQRREYTPEERAAIGQRLKAARELDTQS